MNQKDLPILFECADQPIFIIDETGEFIFANSAFNTISEICSTEGINPQFKTLIDVDSLVNVLKKRELSQSATFNISINERSFSARCQSVDLGKKRCFIIYISIDNLFIENQTSGIEDLLEMTSDGLFEYLPDSGELKGASNFYKVFGYKSGEFNLTYSRWITMIHPEDVPLYLERFESLLIGDESSNSTEFRVLFKGGVYRWVKSNLKAIGIEKGKMPKRIVGNIMDVHEHRQIFEATKVIFKDMAKIRGKAFFKSMAYNISQIIGVKYCVIAAPIDKDFCDMKALAFWENGDYLKDFEYPLAGTPCEHVIADKNYKVYSNRVDELFPEDTYLADNGIVSYWGVPFFDSQDKPMGHVFVMDDKPIIEENWIDSVLRLFAGSIGTELERNNARLTLKEQKLKAEMQVRQRTRSLEQALIQLDTLFYRSSHDMRAPIATLEGLITVLKHEKPEMESTLLMSLLDGNISDMKRLNAGIGQIGNIRNHQIKVTGVDLRQVIEGVLSSVKQTYYSQKQSISVDVPDSLIFYTDETLLQEVLSNILENAFKFSKGLNAEQLSEIHVRANVSDNELLVSVSDNGVGVSYNQKEKIFQMFFRGNETKSGLGLGLFKTEMALSKIKGTINIESTEGRGTDVEIKMLSLEVKKEVVKSF